MKRILTALIVLMCSSAYTQAQENKKSKRSDKSLDTTTRGYKFIPKDGSNDPFVLKMNADSANNTPVKMPNSYRKDTLSGPVPMPVYQIGSDNDRPRGINIQNNEKPKKRKRNQ